MLAPKASSWHFTYTGQRYNDGRKDLQKTLAQQFLEAVEAVNKAVFDNGKINRSKHGDAMDLRVEQADLVYIDPPYYSPLSDNEYVRRYHFVEGLARDWKGVEIQEHTQTKNSSLIPRHSLPEKVQQMRLIVCSRSLQVASSLCPIPQTACLHRMKW